MQYFEEAIQKIGWGPYHKFLVFFSAFNLICNCVASTVISFGLPIGACDLNLSRNLVLWINALFSLGKLTFSIFMVGQAARACIGGIIFGILADIIHRKCIIIASLILLFCSSFASGFACDTIMLIISTFLLGYSYFGHMTSIKVNLIEILPMKCRGYYCVLIDMFYLLGYLLSSCICWVAKPHHPTSTNEPYVSWRMLYGFPSFLCIICICLSGLLQINPRTLLAKKRHAEAFLLLKYMFAVNNSKHPENFDVEYNDIKDLIKSNTISMDRNFEGQGCLEMCFIYNCKLLNIFRVLLQGTIIKYILLVSVLRSALFGGYQMTNIWLAKSLQIHIMGVNCSYTSFDLLHLPNYESRCEGYIPARLFRDYFLIATGALVGLFIFSHAVDTLGRRIPLMIAVVCCSLACIPFVVVNNYWIRYVGSIFYMMGFAIANSSLDIVILENLPTISRATGFSLTYTISFALNIISRLLINTQCSILFFFMGAVMVAANVLGYFLPDLKLRPMLE